MDLAHYHGHHGHYTRTAARWAIRRIGRYVRENWGKRNYSSVARTDEPLEGEARLSKRSRFNSDQSEQSHNSSMTGGFSAFPNSLFVSKRWHPKHESKGHRRYRKRVVKNAYVAAMANARPNQFIKGRVTSATLSTLNTQAVVFLDPLLSWYGSAGSFNDIKMLADDTNMRQTSGGTSGATTFPLSNTYKGKLHITRACQTIDLYNSEAFSLWVDVYDYICRKPAMQGTMSAFLAYDPQLTGDTALPSGVQNMDWTPFNDQLFIKDFKILGKRTLELDSLKTCSWEIHGKRGTVAIDNINGMVAGDQIGLPGYTRGVLLVVTGPLISTTTYSAASISAGLVAMTRNVYTTKWIPEDAAEWNTVAAL